jgi:hemoglobin-like flavoprotein
MSSTAGKLFYGKLFQIDPPLEDLFTGDLEQQGQKFMQILAVAVGSLTNLPMLVPIVQQLGVRHASYGVTQEHYDTARDALMWTLAMVLQDRYTDEVRSAWVSAYAMLAGIMKEAAWGKP